MLSVHPANVLDTQLIFEDADIYAITIPGSASNPTDVHTLMVDAQ